MLGVEQQMRDDVNRLEQYIADWKQKIDAGAYVKTQSL